MMRYSSLLIVFGLLWTATATAQTPKTKLETPEQDVDWRALSSLALKVKRATKAYEKRVQVETSIADVVRKVGKNSPPSRAYAWVRQNIGFEPYGGLLRGARGSLLARKANGVDQAALLAEIYRAQGYPVRFVSGQVYQRDARAKLAEINGSATLISPASMSGEDFTKTSYVATDQARYLQPISQHVWVQVQYKGQWMTADPVFSASFGTTTAQAEKTQDNLLEELGGTIRIRVKARLNDEQDNELVSVVGRIDKFSYANIGLEFVNHPRLKGQMMPVLSVGGQTKVGEPFPADHLDWLRVEFVVRRGRIEDRFSETLFKRGEANSMFEYDQTYWGIALLPGWVPPDFLRVTTARSVGASSNALAAFTKAASKGESTAGYMAILNEVHRPYAFLISSMYATHLDRLTRELAYSMGVTPILHEPRVIMTGILRREDHYDFRLSARGNSVEAMPKLGVPASAASGFLSVHGRMAHQLAAEMLSRVSDSPVVSVDRLFKAASANKVRITTIYQGNLNKVSKLGLGKDVKKALVNSVRNQGVVVLMPRKPVELDHSRRTGWWALNPTTGNLTGSLGERMLSSHAAQKGEDDPDTVIRSALRTGALILARVDAAARDSSEFSGVVCRSEKNVKTLAGAFCATKKAIPAPELKTCFAEPSNAFDENALLNRRTCIERTKDARCGVRIAEALMHGELTALYTSAAEFENPQAKKKVKRAWKPATGLTCK